MKIKYQIILFLLVIFAGFLLKIFTQMSSENEEISDFIKHSQAEKQELFIKMMSLQGAKLQAYAYDNSIWDEMLDFVNTRDYKWAQVNIEHVIPTFDIQLVWIFDRKIDNIYFVNTGQKNTAAHFPLDKSTLKKLFSQNSFNHFFVLSNMGLTEIRTAPIQPSNDFARKSKPAGYLVAANVWSPDHVNELSELMSGHVYYELGGAADKHTHNAADSILNHTKLTGWDNAKIADLYCATSSQVIKNLLISSNDHFWSSLLFGIVIILSAAVFLIVVIEKPLNLISKSLQTEDITPIEELGLSRGEFGSLASLIISFFEQKNLLSQEKRLLYYLMNYIPDMIYFKDVRGRFTRINDSQANVLGIRTTYEAVGKTEFDYFKKPVAEKIFREEQEVLESRIPIIDKAELIEKSDGSTLWVSATKVPITDNGKAVGIVCLSRDITERRKAEEEIKKAKEAAESADRAKSMFLANMSHEIRTPLNAILGFTELLKPKITDFKNREYLTAITRSGNNLLKLINDLLDLSKIEAGKMNLKIEEVDLFRLFQEVKQIFLIQLSQKGVNFKINYALGTPKVVMADEIRLRQILFNLLGNAVKFTEKGHVCLGIRSADTNGNKTDIVISVEDTGIGISEEQHKSIFESFVQQEGQDTRKYGGTGLGLAITRRLTEMMNGHITLESKTGEGSVFFVHLPAMQFVPGTENTDAELEVLEEVTSTKAESKPEETAAVPEQIREYISTTMMTKWADLKEGMMIDDIMEFAEELGHMSSKNKISRLLAYSKELYQSADSFNVEQINKLLEDFPALADKL